MADEDLLARLRQLEAEVRDLARDVATLTALDASETDAQSQALESLSDAIERIGDALQALIGKWDIDHRRIEDRFREAEVSIARAEARTNAHEGALTLAGTDRANIWAELRKELGVVHGRISKNQDATLRRFERLQRAMRTEASGAEERVQLFIHRWLPLIIKGLLLSVLVGLGVMAWRASP